MRFSKVFNVACASALICASLHSVTAASLLSAGHVLTDKRATATTPPAGYPAAHVNADDPVSQQQQQRAGVTTKKRPNLFVRVITAPFRGLARLFGGNHKSTQAARKQPVKAQPQTTTTAATATAAANATSSSGVRPPAVRQVEKSAQPAQSLKVSVSAEAATSVRTGSSSVESRAADVSPVSAPPATIIANNNSAAKTVEANAAAATTTTEPRAFTPFIEGVGGDPLTQGRALLEKGYLNEAISELSVAAVAGPDLVEANNLLGLAYDRRGLHKQAQEFYERALSVAPQNARVLNNLGHSLYLDDRYNDALARLKSAARLAPADTEVANNLALVFGRLNKYEEAFKQFKSAGGEFYASMHTAALLMTAGRDRDAIKYYEAARLLNPASSDVLRQLITLYTRTGQREKAEAAERALEQTPTKKGASASS